MYDECQSRLSLEDEGFYLKMENGERKMCYGLMYVRVALPRINDLGNIPFLPYRYGKTDKSYVS